jgi:hypothetical protein
MVMASVDETVVRLTPGGEMLSQKSDVDSDNTALDDDIDVAEEWEEASPYHNNILSDPHQDS